MKRIIITTCFLLFAVVCCTAQGTDVTPPKWGIKEGSVMTYHVKSNGMEYDFIVTVKSLTAAGNNVITFDWKMTDPVNKSGTINISFGANLNARALYNRFSNGEKTLEEETSVFISFGMSIDMVMASEGDEVKIKVDGASAAEETFTVVDEDHDFSFKENGVEKTIKTIQLKNKTNGKTITVYNESTNAFIVDMSIGFDISLKSVH